MTMPSTASAVRPVRLVILIMGPASLLSVSLLVDTLREMNRQAKQVLYEVALLRAPWPLPMNHSAAWLGGVERMVRAVRCDWLWVVADQIVTPEDSSDWLEVLSSSAANAQLVAAVGAGIWWLGRAGLLDDVNVCVPAELYDRLAADFPLIRANQRLFDIDGRIASSSGGMATMDLLLTLLTQRQGAALTNRVRDTLNIGPLRTRQELQATTALSLAARREARLMEALHLMESNLNEPIAIDDIASLVGLSKRHLERLFRAHLDVMPSAYYLGVRLDHARTLVEQTSKTIAEISSSTGFSTSQYFAVAFRKKFGVTASELRPQRHAV